MESDPPSDAAIGTCQQQRLFMRGQRQPEVTLQALHPIERGSKNPGAGGGFKKDDTTAKTTTARTRTTTKTTTKTTKTMTTRTTTEPEPWVLASKANGRGLANHFRELKWALRKCHFWSFNVQKPADLATYPIISVIIYYDHPLYSCIILHTWWFLSLLKILFLIRISEYPINMFTIVIILIYPILIF